MAAILKVLRLIPNPTQSTDAYSSRNNPAKFHPDRIWKDEALGFFATGLPNKKNNKKHNKNKMSSDTGSVPHPKIQQ